MTYVRRLEPPSNIGWEVHVTPDGNGDVTLSLRITTDCSAQGAICTQDGGKLSGGHLTSVPGPNTPATPPNTPAAGAPAITGTTQVGATLTADTTVISDGDGLGSSVFAYQWLADGAEINGATASTYTLVAADAGKAISVRVSFTDDAGNGEELTSATTATVVSPPLTASTHDVPSSHDGSAALTFELRFSEEFQVSYVTMRDHVFTVTGGSVTYVRRLEPGKNVRWEITVTPGSGAAVAIALNSTTDCSAQGAICTEEGRKLSGGPLLVVPGPNTPATGAPTITGTAQVGKILTAGTSNISDDDGLDDGTFAYQWLADSAEINGATASTYTLVTADEGKAIKVQVSFTDNAGNNETLTSAATGAVDARPNSPATGAPTISGTAQVGETLTANTLGIADEDRLKNVSFSYQWLADDEAISGATGSSYTLADTGEGKTIRVRVSFTDDAGNEESLTSEATDAVAVPLTASLESTPDTHDGENVFTFELGFSEEFPLSYKTLRDHAFTAAGGTVTNAERITKGSNLRWLITVRPDGDGQVAITPACHRGL